MPANRDAITDVPGIRVGHWTDRRAATGCTVVVCETGAVGGVDVRGAAPGTRETDLLRPGNLVEEVHAVLLTGGSAFGLAAADGVMQTLEAQGIGLRFAGHVIPIVPAAVLFDLGLGRPRRPDAEAGARATRAARGGTVAQGSVGAGTGATVAKLAGRDHALKGGLGTASETLASGAVVGALIAVNAVGVVGDPRTGRLVAGVRGAPGRFQDAERLLRRRTPAQPVPAEAPGENTTIGVIATNARLTKTQANRLATVAHDGLARTIWPAHTRSDGDTLFVLATGEVALDEPAYAALEALAVRAAERAILRGVTEATGLGGMPSATEWRTRTSH